MRAATCDVDSFSQIRTAMVWGGRATKGQRYDNLPPLKSNIDTKNDVFFNVSQSPFNYGVILGPSMLVFGATYPSS